MEKEKSAVEWLFEQMPKKLHPHYKKQLQQAKEMDREQKIEFAKHCLDKSIDLDILMAYNQVEIEYTNRTFKSE